MPRAIDLSAVSPERAAEILRRREAKKREYARRKETLLARNRAWREANPEKAQQQMRTWRENNPQRAAANKRADYERHRERRLANQAQRFADLNDATVRAAVAHGGGDLGLTCRDIPDEVLPLFRTQMLIRRELRNQKAAA